MKPSKRIMELAERLNSPGDASSKLSGSELHEIADEIFDRAESPTIVCLCGSTRFWKQFQEHSLRLSKEGKIVLSIGMATASDSEHLATGAITEADKRIFDELHLRKIDLADEILVLNVGGYIGESTKREINYAENLSKPISYSEPISK